MLDLSLRPHPLVSQFESLLAVLNADLPAELATFRRDALNRFSLVGLPTRSDEEFRYLSARTFEDFPSAPAYGATISREQIESTITGGIDSVVVVFVNGEAAPELSSYETLPEGVIVGTLRAALAEGTATGFGTIATLEGKLGSTNDERLVDLNSAYFADGGFIFVPRGLALERPIQIIHVTQADHGTFLVAPRNLIVLEDGAEAKIIESYVGLGGTYASIPVTEVKVGERAHLDWVRVQQESETAIHLSTTAVFQAEASVVRSTVVNFGGLVVRNELNADVRGERTETWLNGVNVGQGEQLIDNHTRLDHAVPNCQSFEVYKSVLDDRSTGVFNGKIFVYEDAQKTDAKQTNQAILLSGQATYNTKPQLEIFADDVKCTHGATVGTLRDDALFYLRSRGIPEKQARALLIYAFAADVLEGVSLPEVRSALEAALFAKLV